MAIGAEEAAPAWVPAVALAVPVVIMLLVGIPALRRRGRAERLELVPLPAARVGPAWKVPYDLGRSLTARRR